MAVVFCAYSFAPSKELLRWSSTSNNINSISISSNFLSLTNKPKPQSKILSHSCYCKHSEGPKFSVLKPNIPWDNANIWTSYAFYLLSFHVPLSFCGLSVLAHLSNQPIIDPQTKAISLLFIQMLELTLVYWVLTRVVKPQYDPFSLFQVKKKTRNWVLGSALGFGFLGLLVFGTSLIVAQTEPVEASNQAVVKEILSSGDVSQTCCVLAYCIVTPLLEEIIYRGILLGSLASQMKWYHAVVISSSIFGLAHFSASSISIINARCFTLLESLPLFQTVVSFSLIKAGLSLSLSLSAIQACSPIMTNHRIQLAAAFMMTRTTSPSVAEVKTNILLCGGDVDDEEIEKFVARIRDKGFGELAAYCFETMDPDELAQFSSDKYPEFRPAYWESLRGGAFATSGGDAAEEIRLRMSPRNQLIAAYMMTVGRTTSPSVAEVKRNTIFFGGEVEDEEIEKLVARIKDKDMFELVAYGCENMDPVELALYGPDLYLELRQTYWEPFQGGAFSAICADETEAKEEEMVEEK